MNGVVDLSQCFCNAAASPGFYSNSMNAAQRTTTTSKKKKKKKLQLDENLQRMHSTWIEFSFDPIQRALRRDDGKRENWNSKVVPIRFSSHHICRYRRLASRAFLNFQCFRFSVYVAGTMDLWTPKATQICNCLSKFRQHNGNSAATVFCILTLNIVTLGVSMPVLTAPAHSATRNHTNLKIKSIWA